MISIEAKLDAIHQALDQVADETQYLDIDILRKLGRGVVRKSKQRYLEILHKRTKTFYNSIRATTSKRKRVTVVTSDATNPQTGARYPWILAAGKRMEPRTGKTITFPAFDWINRPGNQYMASNQADDDIESVIEYTLKKLKEKGVLA